MRTIKFRAQVMFPEGGIVLSCDKAEGEWVYGDLHLQSRIPHIHSLGKKYPINPGTVGQFTGLYDKDGKEIYEWDILQLKYSDGSYHSSSVYYAQQKGYWAVDVSINERIILGYIDRTKLVVIGNIHDNPELLKGGNDE